MRILRRNDFLAQKALERASERDLEYRGYRLLSHYYRSHIFSEVQIPDGSKLNVVLVDDVETKQEFHEAVKKYIDGLTKKVKE